MSAEDHDLKGLYRENPVGFLPIEPEEDGDEWCVEFHPGNFMAFYPPWDGDYDT